VDEREKSGDMDISSFFNPIVTPGVAAAIFSVAIIALSVKNRAAIGQGLDQLRVKIFTRSGLFWTVNLVFMAVSVLHAGIFFGITGNGHDLPGMAQYLGFAVSFFLDLVTVILMQAMLEARYRGEEARARQFLLFITVCCATSTFANLAISLNDFNASTMLPHAPTWVQATAPYVLSSFPLFVIMMSIAAEMIVNVRPLESLDSREYEADEEKRLKILQIRNTYLQKQADEELRALTIHAQMKVNKQLRKGKMPNGFRWFWEKPVEVDTVITGVTAQLKAMYEPQIEDLKRRLEEMQTQQDQMPLTGITARLTAQKAREPQTNTSDMSWVFADQKETPIPEHISPSARTQQPHDEYGDEARQNSGPIQMTTSLFWVTKHYPRVASEWFANNRKTVTLEEIIEVTGHTKRRLSKAALRRSSRNPELVLVSSVIEWLKTAPIPTHNESQNDALPRVMGEIHQEQNGHFDQPKETVNLDQYPEILV
jgi:hypothetical protein